jgi:hypothetical protein
MRLTDTTTAYLVFCFMLMAIGFAFLTVCVLSYFGIHETQESASATRAS